MTVKRAAAWLGGSTLLAAWLAAAAAPSLAPQPRADTSIYQPAESDRAAIALAKEAERLRNRLGVVPAPRPVTRNPFSFASKLPVAEPTAPASDVPVSPPSSSSVPAAPLITLLGLAEDSTGANVVRTAILSLGGELLLVKEGEVIGSGRYRLTQIGADAIELEDTIALRTVRVALP